MTASFSTGLNEHVEYTNLPPTANSSKPLSNTLTCTLKPVQDSHHQNLNEIITRKHYWLQKF